MKLRLDEYYYIIKNYWDDIEEYMPEDMVNRLDEFSETHNQDEIFDYLDKLYAHIQVVDKEYNIEVIDLEKSYIIYTAIIKIDDKYYSFEYYDTNYWNFKDTVDVDEELTEVKPKEKTIIVYE